MEDIQERLLEDMVDKHTLADVVGALKRICHAKEEHVTVNWQDKDLAKDWSKCAGVLAKAWGKISEIGL